MLTPEENQRLTRVSRGAPMGELQSFIAHGQARGFREVKKLVKAATGLRWRAFCAEVERRTSARYVHHRTMLGQEHQFDRW